MSRALSRWPQRALDGRIAPRTSTAEQVGRKTIGEAFDRRSNALNFLRLASAALVLVDHVHVGGGFCIGTACSTTDQAGAAAVDGFFAASGFLIAGSALSCSLWRFLWRRCLVMQMLVLAGAARLGYWPLLPTVLLATLPIAAMSWVLVERPAMRLKAASLRRAPW